MQSKKTKSRYNGGCKHHQKRHESSSERLARSHAQDVLSLSLELERTKQALQQECMAHDATRSTLSQARAQQTILTTQLEQVQQQHHVSISIQKEEDDCSITTRIAKQHETKKRRPKMMPNWHSTWQWEMPNRENNWNRGWNEHCKKYKYYEDN